MAHFGRNGGSLSPEYTGKMVTVVKDVVIINIARVKDRSIGVVLNADMKKAQQPEPCLIK